MNIFDLLIVQPIFNLLIVLYSIVPWSDFGVAIILFTIIVRFALYPLTRSMLHQTRAMRKLQPELAKIRKQTKGNRQQAGLLTMELYKKHGINPFRQIGILLIQLPIFIALYHVIQIFTSQRDRIADFTYNFLEGIEPIRRVIENPDQFNEQLFGIIDLTTAPVSNGTVHYGLLLIVLIMAISQFILTKQTLPKQESNRRLRDIMAEAAEGKDPDQAEMNTIVMQKMMKFLPIMLFFIMLGFPGALALYYATSNLVAIAQQHYLLHQDEEELEALADQAVKQNKYNKATKQHKKATAKAKQKVEKGKGVTVTRITAKDKKG